MFYNNANIFLEKHRLFSINSFYYQLSTLFYGQQSGTGKDTLCSHQRIKHLPRVLKSLVNHYHQLKANNSNPTVWPTQVFAPCSLSLSSQLLWILCSLCSVSTNRSAGGDSPCPNVNVSSLLLPKNPSHSEGGYFLEQPDSGTQEQSDLHTHLPSTLPKIFF